MRVLVASAPIARLTAAQAGAAMARAWAALGAQLAVVPVAEAGRGFVRAWADLTGAADGGWHLGSVFAGPEGLAIRADIENPGQQHEPSSSEVVGIQLAAALAWAEHEELPHHEVWLEVPAWTWADGGAGFWEVLGEHRDELRGARLHLVTTSAEQQLHLTGFRGITAATGRASGMHPGDMLAADQALVDWCSTIGSESLGTTPGSGAVGGLGAAVLALGGDVVTGPGECARLAGLAGSLSRADLLVVGYDQLDFGSKGGDVVPLLSELAAPTGCPVLLLGRENFISAREVRTMGVEQAIGLCDGPGRWPDEAGLTRLVEPVARTWSW